jgi:hypothetical protein
MVIFSSYGVLGEDACNAAGRGVAAFAANTATAGTVFRLFLPTPDLYGRWEREISISLPDSGDLVVARNEKNHPPPVTLGIGNALDKHDAQTCLFCIRHE